MIFNPTGGGVALNYKVVGGTSEPITTKLNTIWINTDAEITSWTFDVTEPENPTEGMVWFTTSTSSMAAFNILKKNAIYVYPTACHQYIDGAFVRREAFLWNGSEFLQFGFLREYLIEDGVIDLTAHPYIGESADINNSYNGMPAVRLGADNGYWRTHQFDNVEVPDGATTFTIDYYLLAAHDHDPVFTLGAVTVEVDRGGSDRLENGQVVMDVSGIAGTTVSMICKFVGNASVGYSYIANAWFE